jgi:hypothetical protein
MEQLKVGTNNLPLVVKK